MGHRSIDGPAFPSTARRWIDEPSYRSMRHLRIVPAHVDKKGGVPKHAPKQIYKVKSDFGAGGSRRGGGLRGRRLGLPVAAAERLHAELGELLGTDAVVRLDHRAHGIGQPLALDQNESVLLRRLLLA